MTRQVSMNEALRTKAEMKLCEEIYDLLQELRGVQR